MSVRTTSAILTELLKFVPTSARAATPLLAGQAAAANLAEQAASDLADNLLTGNAEDEWLDLLARGVGLSRTPQETNLSLRARMRNVPDALTRPAILAAVNALLLPFTATEAVMVEWHEGFYYDTDYYDDPYMPYSFGPNAFTLIIPDIGGATYGGAYYGDFAYDTDYYGSAPVHFSYGAIFALVDQLRAAGIRWALATVAE